MNAPHPSIEQARPRKACVTHVSFEALEGAEEIERELLDTPLGMKLAELLTLAQDTHIKSERDWERATVNGRRSYWRATPECLLAEFLHDTLCEVKTAAEQYIAVLAAQEAQAERIAEEADRQYEATWSAFVAGVAAPRGAA